MGKLEKYTGLDEPGIEHVGDQLEALVEMRGDRDTMLISTEGGGKRSLIRRALSEPQQRWYSHD